ncbi:histidine--tRNA ligase [Govanella unica]|uniref:Histidine--tRNA ligase n=1 Tax=Govanella unica TaxID=2975056 RepID=A0A9X3Z5N5_9PROT|nr:histidine--tRNA ligase [Govania unica]
MARLQPVRGTHDLLPDDARRFRHITETFRKIAERYGHQEIATPIFEFTEVFSRSLGETTDVVTKEMYTFEDRSGDSITLRPEYTAGIARAFISNGLQQEVPCKFFGWGPMFRHERPQKGRLRQFHQLDVEILGVGEPQADIEVLALAHDLLTALGLGDKVTLELNSLGDLESRTAYRAKLLEFLERYEADLSEDSRTRMRKNPLRVLDSKDEGDKRIVADAPLLIGHLNASSAAFFAAVQDGLGALGVPHVVNPRIVRGLDYYSHTAFEFTTTALGAQGTVLAGGRYDGLVGELGGPATPGIGWASGIERLAMLVENMPEAPRPVALVPVGDGAEREALKLAHQLRQAGLMIDLGYKGNMGKRMKRADKIKARAAVIVGEDELERGVVALRDLDAGTQSDVPLADLAAVLAALN